MSITATIKSHSLSQLPTMHRRNFSLNTITNSIMPPSTTTTTSQVTTFAKPIFDIESFAYISIFKALQNTPSISHQEMLMIKDDITTRIRGITGSITNSRQGEMRVIHRNTGQLPLVLPLTREILRKVLTPVDSGREPRWTLRPEFSSLDIRNLTDAELLLQVRSVVSGASTTNTPISRSDAAKVAEFVAHALPENFALSRRQMVQLLGMTSCLDRSAEEGKLGSGEMRRGLRAVGEGDVVRLLRLGEGDPLALELLKDRLGEGRRV